MKIVQMAWDKYAGIALKAFLENDKSATIPMKDIASACSLVADEMLKERAARFAHLKH